MALKNNVPEGPLAENSRKMDKLSRFNAFSRP